MSDLLEYLQHALHRADTGELDSEEGSHLSGVFGRAAKRFENEAKAWVERSLLTAGIDYDTQLRHHVKSNAQFSRLTLGDLVLVLKEAAQMRQARGQPALTLGSRLLARFGRVNKTWVAIKHGEEPPKADLIDGLRSMQQTVTQIRKQS
jgi:hypothetical protein